MEINQDEVKEIKNIGKLNDSEVKLVTLKGGFHIGMGKKSKEAKKSDILAVGSHPALITHQISKKFEGKFEESMAKNEKEAMPNVTECSDNLSKSQKNVLGLDIFVLEKNENVEFKVTKHNFEIFNIKATRDSDNVILEKTEKNSERLKNVDKKELSKSLEKTIQEFARANKLKIKKNF